MKKKIFVAALASLCVAAGAAGIAACGENIAGDAHDPALYAAYQTYAAENENPKTYEEWVADLLAGIGTGGSQGQQGQPGPEGPQGAPGERGDDGDDGIDGEDGVGIDDVKMVEIQGKQYFEFTFSNGKIVRIAVDGSDRQETNYFTITAVDNNGEPVADAYFNVGYTDSFNRRLTKEGSSTTTASSYYAVKTNSKGIATFYTFPEDHEEGYSVYLADPYSISSNGRSSAVPRGYTVNFGTSGGMNNTSAPFVEQNGNYSVTVNFVIDNSWASLYDSSNDLVYKRYAKDPLNSDEIVEENEAYVKKSQKGKYNYFSFNPYNVNMPAGEVDQSVIDGIIQKARDAASGVYRFSFTANNSRANVQLNAFNFIGGSYFVKNDDGSPADTLVEQRSGKAPTDEETLRAAYARYQKAEGNSARSYAEWLPAYTATFSGGNYVDITVEEDVASASFCLGFTTEINCDVTITVERIGNVTKWTNTQKTAAMPSGEERAMEEDGRILEVPLDSVIVKDDNGAYRLGSTTGPQIYVQLNNPTRANQNSMIYLTSYTTPDPESTSVSVFNYYTEKVDEATNTGVREYTDYTAVVQGYSALANSDGGYPVNDLLKTILENFCRGYIGWSNYDEYWVAACYYYGAPSDGSEASPYDLTSGRNSVNLHASGTTYLSFRPSSAGYYSITVEGCTVGDVQNAINVDGTNYVYVSNAGISFTVTGSGTATVTLGTLASRYVIEYSSTEVENPDGGITTTERGTAENPVAVTGIGVFQVNVDHSAYGNKIAVDLKAALGGSGTYSITVYGSTTATVETSGDAGYESVVGQNITISDNTPTRLWFDNAQSGTFFIKITKIS